MSDHVKLTRIDLDHDALAEILKGEDVQALVTQAAFGVRRAAQAKAGGRGKVYVNTFVTDRHAARVVVADREFVAENLRSGTLKKLAIAEGLDVSGRGDS